MTTFVAHYLTQFYVKNARNSQLSGRLSNPISDKTSFITDLVGSLRKGNIEKSCHLIKRWSEYDGCHIITIKDFYCLLAIRKDLFTYVYLSILGNALVN